MASGPRKIVFSTLATDEVIHGRKYTETGRRRMAPVSYHGVVILCAVSQRIFAGQLGEFRTDFPLH